jgi:hypothetical protein
MVAAVDDENVYLNTTANDACRSGRTPTDAGESQRPVVRQ